MTGLIFIMRKFFTLDKNEISTPDKKVFKRQFLIYIFFILIPVILIRFIQFSPNAGTNFTQAWVPLYINASFQSGHFLHPQETFMGEGIITNTLHYQPNLMGLVILFKSLGVIDIFQMLLASSVLVTLLTFFLLLFSLIKSKVASLFFGILFLMFFLFEYNMKIFFGNIFYEEYLALCGALICYFIFKDHTDYRRSLTNAALISTFLVFGRIYGIYYSLTLIFIFIVFFFKEWKKLKFLWSSLVFLIFLFSLKEIITLMSTGNPFYPWTTIKQAFPYTFQLSLKGFFSGFGLLYIVKGSPVFNINCIYVFFLIPLIIAVFIKKITLKQFLTLIAPMLFIIIPFSLEIIMQYRKSPDLSKLFFISLWFFIWYPPYLLSHFPQFFHKNTFWSRNKKRLAIICLFLFLLLPLFNLYRYNYRIIAMNFLVHFVISPGLPLNREPDEKLIAIKMKSVLTEDEMNRLINGRIMYFHHEPGIGLRCFIGGNIFNDIDYWSLKVQKLTKTCKTMKEIMDELQCDALYLSLGMKSVYHNQLGLSDPYQQFQELNTPDNLSFPAKIIELNSNKRKAYLFVLLKGEEN